MYKKYKKRNIKFATNLIIMTCIIISIGFLTIGYASITSTNLNIGVTVSTAAYRDIFISNVEYLSDNGADIANSKIKDYVGTMLHSNIALSTTDANSTISYTITIVNNSNADKQFSGVTYGDEFYSNKNIGYRLEGLNIKDIIKKGESKTFTITFYYNSTNISNNQLESYLNFNFDYYLEGETEVDIPIISEGDYEFDGVSEESPINIQDISNITFVMENDTENKITGFTIKVVYSTTTGSKQSANISLYDENDNVIATQTAQFQGKQNNGEVIVTFNNLNMNNKDKIRARFDKNSVTNGRVEISGITITPIF